MIRPTTPSPPGSRMLYWLAQACKAARKDAGRKPSAIAGLLEIDQKTVTRFEAAKAWPSRTDPDRFVAAYAHLADIEPCDLWVRAAEMYRTHGVPPE